MADDREEATANGAQGPGPGARGEKGGEMTFHPDLLAWAVDELARRRAEDAAVACWDDVCRVKKARGIRRKRVGLSRAMCRELLGRVEEGRAAE